MNESITIRDAQSSEFDGIFALHKKLFRSEIDSVDGTSVRYIKKHLRTE